MRKIGLVINNKLNVYSSVYILSVFLSSFRKIFINSVSIWSAWNREPATCKVTSLLRMTLIVSKMTTDSSFFFWGGGGRMGQELKSNLIDANNWKKVLIKRFDCDKKNKIQITFIRCSQLLFFSLSGSDSWLQWKPVDLRGQQNDTTDLQNQHACSCLPFQNCCPIQTR